MKKISIVLVLLISTGAFSQYVLKTPDGKTVKLHANGTWEYVGDNSKAKAAATVIPKSSSAKYTSKFKKYTVWYNPELWIVDTVTKEAGPWWEATFYSTDYAITGYCLESRLSFPLKAVEDEYRRQYEPLGEIKSFQLTSDTFGTVERTTFHMDLLTNGIEYHYTGYIYSSPKGSFQFLAGTQKEIWIEDKSKIMELLSGIVRLQ